MRPLVLGTAGHIDHGKTALVHALTGTNTDRLPDERRRGITIDLGFASLVLPGGTPLSIVDVPGHEAFIRNMLAGATGLDLVMLVVAADEGPMPQTREHLAILDLLGVRRGVVALTRIDLVEPDWLELVREELHELLAGSCLAGAPIVDVSARTRQGLDHLLDALDSAAADATLRAADDLFRMPIDRIFTVRGTGTVVTGTVWSGSLRRDAHVHVLPAGFEARVRGLQQHGEACDEVGPGARAAVALAGVDRDALTRGDTLLTGWGWAAAGILTVKLRVLNDATAPIAPRQRVRVHAGTAEVLGRVALLPVELNPGEEAIVQLRLEQPIVTRALDRIVVRSYSPAHTIGGGIVLEPMAPKRKRLPDEVREALTTLDPHPGPPGPATLVSAAVTLAGPAGIDLSLLPLTTGLTPGEVDSAVDASEDVVRFGARAVARPLLLATQSAILDLVKAFHASEPLLDGVERESARQVLRQPPLFDAAVTGLLGEGRLAVAGNALALPDHSPVPAGDAAAAMERLADLFAGAGLQPPDLSDLPEDLVRRRDLAVLIRFLERDGTLLRMSPTRLIHAPAVSEAVIALKAQLVAGQPLEVADFKQILNLTRKHLIPLLEHFDRTGVTQRRGEARVLVAS
ncbi:MAG: selenocysteine-specific translation elongation factor [Gemmatimonadetes bacterium]|nr:selenocysteine-specific translation elongation factor [Gemmatimonadota bacterium]